ncbi:MAG TPA: hypothetical protein VGT02_04885, partial [Methylomirabilota bacterium]|nr:hypothetical protein [Methylomirabilota bacterium]
QMSENVRARTRAVEQALRARPSAAPVVAVSAAARPAAPAAPAPPAPVAAPAAARQVAGLGPIKELGEMARTMDLLWQREARSHIGHRVQISVVNSQELAGTLLEATDDGLLLEQAGGGTVAITYRRVQGIEAL